MERITHHRTVDAPLETVWAVVTDHQLYGAVAPNLASVEPVDGDGEGGVRRCVDTDGNEWTETITDWTPKGGYAVSVDVADSDFHRRLFHRFEGEWRLSEVESGVRITIEFAFEPKYGPFGRLITKVFAYKAPDIVAEILDAWEAEIANRQSGGREKDGESGPSSRSGPDGVDGPTNALYR